MTTIHLPFVQEMLLLTQVSLQKEMQNIIGADLLRAQQSSGFVCITFAYQEVISSFPAVVFKSTHGAPVSNLGLVCAGDALQDPFRILCAGIESDDEVLKEADFVHSWQPVLQGLVPSELTGLLNGCISSAVKVLYNHNTFLQEEKLSHS